MSEEIVHLEHDDLQTLDNVLADAGTGRQTRAWLLKRAGAGALAVGAASTLGPVSSALAAGERSSGDSVKTVINTAITAEAFAVVFLNEVLGRSSGTPSGTHPLVNVLRAAGAAEFDHYAALKSVGAQPLTTHIWIPDALFGDGGAKLFANIELAETLFINAYLIGITTFGAAKQAKFARYAGEILGTEAEHRVLARFAQESIKGQKNPQHVANNVGFEVYKYSSMAQIVAQLEGVGIGFGKQGKGAGKFYDFDGAKPESFSAIVMNRPA